MQFTYMNAEVIVLFSINHIINYRIISLFILYYQYFIVSFSGIELFDKIYFTMKLINHFYSLFDSAILLWFINFDLFCFLLFLILVKWYYSHYLLFNQINPLKDCRNLFFFICKTHGCHDSFSHIILTLSNILKKNILLTSFFFF